MSEQQIDEERYNKLEEEMEKVSAEIKKLKDEQNSMMEKEKTITNLMKEIRPDEDEELHEERPTDSRKRSTPGETDDEENNMVVDMITTTKRPKVDDDQVYAVDQQDQTQLAVTFDPTGQPPQFPILVTEDGRRLVACVNVFKYGYSTLGLARDEMGYVGSMAATIPKKDPVHDQIIDVKLTQGFDLRRSQLWPHAKFNICIRHRRYLEEHVAIAWVKDPQWANRYENRFDRTQKLARGMKLAKIKFAKEQKQTKEKLKEQAE